MKTLHFSSEFLIAGESNNFFCPLAKPIYGIQRLKVKKSFLYENWDTVIADFDFYFMRNVAAPVGTLITIPPGQYTGATLATEMQTQLNLADVAPIWTVTYDFDEHFTFTRGPGAVFPFLNLIFNDTSPVGCKILGVAPTTYSTAGVTVSWTTPYRARLLNLFPIYYIAIREIETSDQVNIQMENPNNYNILAWTHAVTHVTSDIKDYKWSEMPLMDHWIEVENSVNLNTVTLTFLAAIGGEFYELDLTDSPWYLELEYQTKESIEKTNKAMEVFY